MPPQPYTLTPAQLLLQAERKAAKLAKKAFGVGGISSIAGIDLNKVTVLKRPWIEVGPKRGDDAGSRIEIITWNVRYSFGDSQC